MERWLHKVKLVRTVVVSIPPCGEQIKRQEIAEVEIIAPGGTTLHGDNGAGDWAIVEAKVVDRVKG